MSFDWSVTGMSIFPKKESLTVEFKSDRKCLGDNEIVEAIVGIANTEGGTLYLGIEDNGVVTGLHVNHLNVVAMGAVVANRTVPSLPVRISIVDGETSVMLFEIPKSNSIIATSSGKVLKRRLKANGEPENIPMFPYEFNSRLADLGKLDFTRQALPEANIEDLDLGEIKRLRNIIEKRNGEKALLELTDDELLRALNLVTEFNGTYVPTVTGMLLVGKEESIEKHIPTAQSAFQVLEGTSIRVNEQLRKPLIATFEFFEQMLKPWNPEREIELGLLNIPVPEFDTRAFREALINAFAHRDYSMLQMTRVIVNDEGMTISNPGSFINGITFKNLLFADPNGRNPALADALKRIGLAERTGRGIDRIFEGSIIYGRPLPDYSESNETSVKLFIPRALPDIKFWKMLTEEQTKMSQPLSIIQLLILSQLRLQSKVTFAELNDMTAVSEIKLRTALNKLIELGLVEELNTTGRTKTYILSSKVYNQEKRGVAYVRLTNMEKIKCEELIIKLASTQGQVTTKEVAELLGVSITIARNHINKLVYDNKLIKVGDTKNTKYQLVKD